jgi:hypothetical protein
MKRTILLMGCGLVLAACDKGGVKMENASVEEVQDAMKKQGQPERFIDPGQWEQKVTLMAIDAPGMPKDVRAAMQKAMSQVQVNNVCLTPEEAKSPREDFFTGKDQNCRYEHFNWGKGKIDLKLQCNHPEAKQMMELAGTYGPRSYSMTMTATTRGKSAEEQMVMKMKVDAKHVGACAPGQS